MEPRPNGPQPEASAPYSLPPQATPSPAAAPQASPTGGRRPAHERHAPGGARMGLLLLALLLVGLGMLLERVTARAAVAPLHDAAAAARPVQARGELAPSEQSTIALYKQAARSVVHITTLGLRRSLVSLDVRALPQGTGSGFVWDAGGVVVTNAHVVRGGQRFRVTLADDSTWEADLVGAEPSVDVAVLRLRGVPPGRLAPLAVGSAAALEVGQSVFAIGNPFGLDQTLTTGVVSGLGREISTDEGETIRGVIQTDAAINPGNSGGPLLDSAGRLVGMNTAILSPSQASAGIGFAVPVETINQVVPRIVRGSSERAGLGVTLGPDSVLRSRRLEGALVLQVLPGSAAERAGVRGTREDPRTGRIELGDVIVAVDGQAVRGQLDLGSVLDAFQPGQAVRLEVLRDGERLALPLTLQPVRRR